MLQSDGAVETQLRRHLIAEDSDRNGIVEHVMQPAKGDGARQDIQAGVDEAEIVALPWTKHHAVFAQSNRFGVVVPRDMPHREKAQAGSCSAHENRSLGHARLVEIPGAILKTLTDSFRP
jgi:hypothetical protein